MTIFLASLCCSRSSGSGWHVQLWPPPFAICPKRILHPASCFFDYIFLSCRQPCSRGTSCCNIRSSSGGIHAATTFVRIWNRFFFFALRVGEWCSCREFTVNYYTNKYLCELFWIHLVFHIEDWREIYQADSNTLVLCKFFLAKEFAGQSRHSGCVAALFLMLLQA